MKQICITKYIHCSSINKYIESFLITKLTTDYWSKPQSTLDISFGVYLFFYSEMHLGISKKSNNQSIKVQSYFFLSHTHTHINTHTHTHTHTQNRQNFSEPECQCAVDASTPHFKINVPLFCCPLFFNQVRINKMAAKDCDLPPQCFRITLKDACSISIDPIGLSSRNKLFFSQTCVPLWL